MDLILFNSLFHLSVYHSIAVCALFLSYPCTYGLIVVLLVWALYRKHTHTYTFLFFSLSGLVSWLVALGLKNIFHVVRPFITLGITPLYVESGFSFPSQHAAVFAGLATAMCFINKKLGIVLSIFAVLIGLSRIVIGVHYPSDVVAGWILGVGLSIIIGKIYKHI